MSFCEISPNNLPLKRTWLSLKAQSRLKARLAEARKGREFLANANRGSPAHLKKVLEMAYGRRGRRKHELLREILPEKLIPGDNHILQGLAAAIESNRASPIVKEPELSEKMLVLIKSQKAQKDQTFTKPNLKSTKPEIPETNIWGRPFPKSRAKNFMKSWYAETLDRLQPPLPQEDWLRLRDLVTGKERWEGPRKRRARAPREGEIPKKAKSKSSREWHNITERYMRRAWKGIFQQCPFLEWKSTHSKWIVTWGRVRTPAGLVVSGSAAAGEGPFAGVDKQGKITGS